MARPREYGERVTTSVRMPPALYERLRQAADDRVLGVNLLVVSAIESYLDRLAPVDEVLRTREGLTDQARSVIVYDAGPIGRTDRPLGRHPAVRDARPSPSRGAGPGPPTTLGDSP